MNQEQLVKLMLHNKMPANDNCGLAAAAGVPDEGMSSQRARGHCNLAQEIFRYFLRRLRGV